MTQVRSKVISYEHVWMYEDIRTIKKKNENNFKCFCQFNYERKKIIFVTRKL